MARSFFKKIFSSLPSVVVAYYVVIPTLSLIMTRINPARESLMTLLYVFGGIAVAVVMLFSKKVRPNISFIIILLSILIGYLLSPNYGSKMELTTPYFVMFTIVPFILPQFVKVDIRLVAIVTMVLPSFGVFYPTELFALTSENVITMDITYSLLPPIVSTVTFLFLYWKKEGVFTKILLLPFIGANCVFLFYVSFFGSRAPIMSVLLAIAFFYVFHVSNESRGVIINRRRLRRVTLLLIVFVCFFMIIVNSLDSFLAQYGLDSGTLEKLSRLKGEGDLSNGRQEIVERSFDALWNSPLYGFGFSSSPYIIDDDYPHNFILQLLIDGGFLLACIVLVPMFYHLRLWSKRCTYNEFAIISLFFFSSVIGALFSLDVWMNPRLWLFFGFLFSNIMSFNQRQQRMVMNPIQ